MDPKMQTSLDGILWFRYFSLVATRYTYRSRVFRVLRFPFPHFQSPHRRLQRLTGRRIWHHGAASLGLTCGSPAQGTISRTIRHSVSKQLRPRCRRADGQTSVRYRSTIPVRYLRPAKLRTRFADSNIRKSLTSQKAHRAALICIFIALSQTPVYTAGWPLATEQLWNSKFRCQLRFSVINLLNCENSLSQISFSCFSA